MNVMQLCSALCRNLPAFYCENSSLERTYLIIIPTYNLFANGFLRQFSILDNP